MPRKLHRIQFSFVFASVLIAIAGVAALLLIEHTRNPDFWVAGLALVVPLVLAAAGKIRQPGNPKSVGQLDDDAEQLRKAVLKQWTDEVELRTSTTYPLPVPFSATGQVVLGQKTITVADSWAAILRTPAGISPELDGTFDSLVDVFGPRGPRGLPNRMVVLGDPGSGKSVIAQALTIMLLGGGLGIPAEDAVRPEWSKAVPVLLPLATWDPSVPLRDWAAVQMARSYTWLGEQIQSRDGTARTLAGSLLDQSRVLMILDGLDEIAADNRLAAFAKLSEAARQNQALIITCRTREYAQIVNDARHPMPRTPVIRLHPLPPDAVRQYLLRAPGQVAQLADKVTAAPDGPLAIALRSPLALWLVTTVYQDGDKDPTELARYPSPDKILEHLLDGLVTAAYSSPAGDLPAIDDPVAVETARRRLIKVADYLGPKLERQNIDWWALPEYVPRWFTGSIVGTLVGCILGVAVGVAAATRFSDHAGVRLGITFAVVTGILSGITSVRPQEDPRTVDLHFHWDYWRFVGCLSVGVAVGVAAGFADARHGGLVAGLVTAAVVGPVCAIPCVKAFTLAPGITAGVTAAIALGLSSGLSAGNGNPLLSGLLAGLVFAVSAWVFVGLFQPARKKFVVTPRLLLDRDRNGSLTVAVTAGIAFGVVYGVALGPFFGMVALVALFVSVAVTVSMWAVFNVSRVWLALAGMVPLNIMGFFHEAYCRGVLRQVGGSYQFRHTQLKEALLSARPVSGKQFADVGGGNTEPAQAG
jgi:hypothetical protein